MNKQKSLMLFLSLAVVAPAGAAEITTKDNDAQQCKMAEHIMLSMMSESESVRSEPVAHELLGDVYSAEGLSVQAQCEYEIARGLAKRSTPAGESAIEAADALSQLFARRAENSR